MRHKCHFCLSFCSVFVVVLSILVVVSITEQGPFIFLRLGEKEIGAFDGIFSHANSGQVDDYEQWIDNGNYLNFTQVLNVVSSEFNLSPRMQFCDSSYDG